MRYTCYLSHYILISQPSPPQAGALHGHERVAGGVNLMDIFFKAFCNRRALAKQRRTKLRIIHIWTLQSTPENGSDMT